jgi:hypothetical protein
VEACRARSRGRARLGSPHRRRRLPPCHPQAEQERCVDEALSIAALLSVTTVFLPARPKALAEALKPFAVHAQG